MIHKLKTMMPQDFKAYVKDIDIVYGFHPTQFGEALILTTPQGVCGFAFTTPENRRACFEDMTRNYSSAHFKESPVQTQPLMDAILTSKPVSLLLAGTPFQIKVWQALLAIPCGSLVSYEDIAQRIGKTQAYRAAANAIGRNPISYVIPCHRVIRKAGFLGGYRGGISVKAQLLTHEGAQGWTV